MDPETYYIISRSSLLEVLDKARWSSDAEALVNELQGRNELEEVEYADHS